MKKILYLIPLFLLFLIPKVYALPNCSSISSATLYDVYGSSSVSSITTNSTTGSTLLCGNAWYTGATSDNTQGLGWEVKLADLNNKDFYYQLNVYYHLEDVGGGTPNIIASPHRNNGIAVGTSNASSLWTSGSLGVSDLSYTINTYSIENGYKYYVVSYIFKSTKDFNRLFIPFATSYTWTGSYYLSGIDITNIGSKSLSSTEINNLLTTQTNQISKDLTNVETNIKDSISDVESNLNSSISDTENNITNSITDTENNITNSITDTENNITNSITDTENNINTNIDEMEEGIEDSINNVLGDCHESVNLLEFEDINYTNLGITSVVKNNVFSLTGSPTSTFANLTKSYYKTIPSGTYTFSINKTLPFGVRLRVYTNETDYQNINIGIGSKSKTFTISSDITHYYVYLYPVETGATYNEVFKLQLQEGTSATTWEPPNEEVCSSKLDNTNDKLDGVNDNLNDLNNSINNSDSSGATDSAGSFFENFEDNDFGLSGIITAPLNTIKTITSNACTPLNLTIPFVNKNISLPCMTDIYEEHFGSFLDIYQIITFGMISYWVCVQIYAMVKGFKNPDKDEIEVMDL